MTLQKVNPSVVCRPTFA